MGGGEGGGMGLTRQPVLEGGEVGRGGGFSIFEDVHRAAGAH